MTREEIINTPELVDFMLDESVIADSREKLRKRLEEICNLAIKALEQDLKTGHWIDRFPAKECKCSVCDFLICISNGSYVDMVDQMKYCPNCGAKMVEPQESEEKE